MPHGAPSLSICIPTHHGRAGTLDDALDSVLAQAGAVGEGELEVCVSDNASRDETEAVVASHAKRHPGVVRYTRNSSDVGAPRNIVAVMQMARGRDVWLMSSDDALVPGALAHVMEVRARHPDAAGITVDKVNYDGTLTHPLPQDPPEFRPALPRTEACLTGVRDILLELGQLFGFMSCNVIDRAVLARAVARADAGLLERTSFAHTYVLALATEARPAWVWAPHVGVLTRLDNSALADYGHVDPAAAVALVLDGYGELWRELPFVDPPLRRDLMDRCAAVYTTPLTLHRLKHSPDTRIGGDLRLARALARHVGVGRRGLRGAPALALAPAAAVRAGHRARARLRPGTPLGVEARRARTEVHAPLTMRAGHVADVRVRVTNLGPAVLRSVPPHPIHLGYRWTTAEAGELLQDGEHVRLVPALRPGRARALRLAVFPPDRPGTYVLRIALVQELIAWWDESPQGGGWARAVEVTA